MSQTKSRENESGLKATKIDWAGSCRLRIPMPPHVWADPKKLVEKRVSLFLAIFTPMKLNTLELRLDWSEMDLFGHINNVSYFKYLQASRVNFWENVGLSQLYEEQGIGPTLAQTICRFKHPLHYPGTIRIVLKVDWVKNSSFQLSHTIYDAQGNACAEGEDVVVLFDYNKNEKYLLTAEQIKTLKQFTEA